MSPTTYGAFRSRFRKDFTEMDSIKAFGRKFIPYLPFLIAFLAVLVAAYHIQFYR